MFDIHDTIGTHIPDKVQDNNLTVHLIRQASVHLEPDGLGHLEPQFACGKCSK